MKKNQLIFVEWNDAITIPEWYGPDDANNIHPTTVHSVGWLIKEDKYSIILAATMSLTSGLLSQITCIPKGCIVTHYDLPLPSMKEVKDKDKCHQEGELID